MWCSGRAHCLSTDRGVGSIPCHSHVYLLFFSMKLLKMKTKSKSFTNFYKCECSVVGSTPCTSNAMTPVRFRAIHTFFLSLSLNPTLQNKPKCIKSKCLIFVNVV